VLSPTDIKLDYLNLPAVLSTVTPAISWRLDASGRPVALPGTADDDGAVQQQAYRIQVAREPGFHTLVRDSGWVESARTLGIPWDGPALEPLSAYLVRVSVRDRAGGESEWSTAEAFETAAVGVGWDVPFLAAPVALAPPDASRPVYLRRRFSLDRVPERPRLLATALGLYEVWINGVRIGEDLLTPGWTAYDQRLTHQTYDVSDLLREGENVVGVVLGYGWYAGDLTWLDARNLYGDRPAVSLALLDTDEANRRSLVDSAIVATDTPEYWEAAHGPLVYAELYHGEEYDGGQDLPGWCEPGAEADTETAAAAWHPCEVLPGSESFGSRVEPEDGPPVRRQDTLSPQRVFTTPAGETVIDFGQNLTGWVRIAAVGHPGERIVLSHAEVLDADGNFYTENLRSARNRIVYTIGAEQDGASGARSWEPRFSFQGFRYVRIDELPETMAADLDDHADRYFTAVAIHSDMEPTLRFSCSDDRINQLHRNILWGWKGNTVHVPTDCPQRDERLGWTGDAQVFVGTAAYLTDVRGFFRRWLRDLALEQHEDGGVPFVIPDVLSAVMHRDPNIQDTHSSTGWGDAAVVCPTTLLDRYDDRETLERQYPSMRKWIDFIRQRAENEVLWNSGFHFGDWVALDAKEGSFFGATPNDLTATAYYAYSTLLTARAAKTLGRTQEAAELQDLHGRIVEAFRREYYTAAGRLAARTQTAHLLALAFDLAPPEHRARTVRDLIALIRENDDHLVTGFLGTPLLLPVLAENGHLEEAYALLTREEYPSWLYQVSQGATTIWEHWDGLKPDGTMWSAEMNSFNHYAYGAVGEWMYRTIGGIDLSRSRIGERSFVIAPRPGGGITSADIRYASPLGDVAVSWAIRDGEMSVTVELPPNTSGTLELPSDGASGDTSRGEPIGPGMTVRSVPVSR